MDSAVAALIEPSWTLVFCKKPGRWWVRLLACGRYNHVKAIAFLPDLRAWLFYDVKFNGTKILLAPEDDPGTLAFLHDYLDDCDMIAMPHLPVPKRSAPQLGFWCTIAMKHLIGIRSRAFRPDRLWRDCIAMGGKPYETLGAFRGALIRTLGSRIGALRERARARRRLVRACPA
jgi:hypothetical protein